MEIIKDKIDVFSSQVDNFMEMPEVIEEAKAEDVPAYTTVDAEDPIDVLVGASMATSRFAGISISRQTPGLYLIEHKTVTLQLEGEHNDQLKARVGSAWISFVDYLN